MTKLTPISKGGSCQKQLSYTKQSSQVKSLAVERETSADD